jgi:hypothetical protein
MLPHRFVDVFETASIIEVFYAHAIRRTAEFPRQAMLLTHIVPPPAIEKCRSKKVEVFFTALYLRGCQSVKHLVSFWSSCG